MSLVTLQLTPTNLIMEPVNLATMKSFFEPKTALNESPESIKQIDFDKEFNFQTLKEIYDETIISQRQMHAIPTKPTKIIKSVSNLFEKYFVVKDAALILPRRSKNCNNNSTLNSSTSSLSDLCTGNNEKDVSNSNSYNEDDSASRVNQLVSIDSSSIDNKSLHRCHQNLEYKQEKLEASLIYCEETYSKCGSNNSSSYNNSNNNNSLQADKNNMFVGPNACGTAVVSDDLEQSGDILIHLRSMVQLLRPLDSISVAVKLCSHQPDRARYLVVVETPSTRPTSNNPTDPNPITTCFESAILGLDLELTNNQDLTPTCSVGLVIPIYSNCEISLNGDGGFKFKTHQSTHIFKPVSIQAMWSAYQYLHKVLENSRKFRFFSVNAMKDELVDEALMQNHEWVGHYTDVIYKTKMDQSNEWYQNEDRSVHREEFTTPYFDQICLTSEQETTGAKIKEKLKEIMISSKDDYGAMSSVHIRGILERELNLSLDNFKKFVDVTIFQFYNQLVECASQVLPYLYLGTEWNASNYDSMVSDGITHVLNVSSDVDNFFPDAFTYLNIRVRDVDETDLLKEFDRTNKFIQEARDSGKCCLVHCKMGVSRSASVVLAYIMKEYNNSLDQAFNFAKQKRTCINPNDGFRVQLATYESILNAHRAKYNLFEPVTNSETNSPVELVLLEKNGSETSPEKCIPSTFSVKEAINKIKSLSSFCLDSPVQINTDVKRQKSCPTQLLRMSPKLNQLQSLIEFQSTNFEFQSTIEETKMNKKSNRLSLNLNCENSDNSDEGFVPPGIVKRQVESINFKLSIINNGPVIEDGEPNENRKSGFNHMDSEILKLHRESLTLNNIENSLIDIKMDFKLLFNELSRGNTLKQQQQQTIMCSPDSKRFKMNKNNSI